METPEGRAHTERRRVRGVLLPEKLASVVEAALQDSQPDDKIRVTSQWNPFWRSLGKNQDGSVGEVVRTGFVQVCEADVINEGRVW